eukprot:s7461_g1.t1
MEPRCSPSSFVLLWWLRFTVLDFCDFLTVVRLTAVANDFVMLEIALTYREAINKAAEGQFAASPHQVPSAFGEACRWLWGAVVPSLQAMNDDSDVCCPGMHRKGTACVRLLGWRGCSGVVSANPAMAEPATKSKYIARPFASVVDAQSGRYEAVGSHGEMDALQKKLQPG